MEIYAVHIADADQHTVRETIKHLSEHRQRSIHRYRHLKDQLRSVFAEVLVRVHAAERLGLANQEIHFSRRSHGKPYLEGRSDYHFNLSHSGDWVVAAFDDAPIGVDIERIAPMDMSIAQHSFSPAEQQDLGGQPVEHRLSYFFTLWTLKESYIKAKGLGLSIDLKSFTVAQHGGCATLQQSPDGDTAWHLRTLSIGEEYAVAVCARNRIPPPCPVYEVSWDELLQRFLTLADSPSSHRQSPKP